MADLTLSPSSRRTRRCSLPPRPSVGVWPVAQRTGPAQRDGRYHPDCSTHPGKMVPELARRIIDELSAPGDLVLDPMCGTGTTLVEAALAGRRAIGVELDPRWADLTEANLDFALDAEQRSRVDLHRGDARDLPTLLDRDAGRVDLICTSPPYGHEVGNPDSGRFEKGIDLCAERNYSADRANLGYARGTKYSAAMAEVYEACAAVLVPGGALAVVTKNSRRAGRCLDLAALTVRLCSSTGLSYMGHVIALHAAMRDGELVSRPSFWQTNAIRKARERGEPAHLTVHEDVLIFTKPAHDPERNSTHGQ